MTKFLFNGSRIPKPDSYEDTIKALVAEHKALRSIFYSLENDAHKIDKQETREYCAAASCVPDVHNEDYVKVWGEEAVLAGACATMMVAVNALIEDKSVKFADPYMDWQLLEARARVQPIEIPEREGFSPV